MKKLAILLALAFGSMTFTSVRAHEHAASPLDGALKQYIIIQTALAGDSLKGVPEAANALAAAAKESAGALPDATVTQAEALAKTSDIKAARAALKPLSDTLIAVLRAQKEKTGHYYEAFCPMANAAWIQADKKIANPYFGASMLTCGEIRKEL